MNKYSVNPKLNKALLSIEEELLCMCDSWNTSLQKIKRYMEWFPKEEDHNIAQYGNLCVDPYLLKKAYLSYGYSKNTVDKWSNDQVWDIYKRQVGYVAKKLMAEYQHYM